MRRAVLIGAAFACALAGCGGAQEPAAPRPTAGTAGKDEPTFRVESMGALARATTKIDLPFLLGADGERVAEPCFGGAGRLDPWDTERPQVMAKLAEQAAAIEQAILAWARETLVPEGTDPAFGAGLGVEYSVPAIVHATDERVRLAADQTCIADSSGLPAGTKAVTTLFGARALDFSSAAPIDKALLRKLQREAQRAGLRLRPVRTYPRARDEQGQPRANDAGEPLYDGPGDAAITEAEFPPPGKRPIHGFKLRGERPVWFAYGDLPADEWAAERDPARCTINLVFEDATPRTPDCAELAGVGFGVSRGAADDRIVVKVRANRDTATAEVAYGETTMILTAGRVVTRVAAARIEEGAELAVDSLILDPGGGEADPLDTFDEPAPPKKRGRRR